MKDTPSAILLHYIFLTGGLMISFMGCGNGRPPLVNLDCQILLDEKPLPSAVLQLESKGNRPTRGEIIDGKVVSWETYEPGDGIPPGVHTAAVFSFLDEPEPPVSQADSSREGPIQSGKMILPKSRIPKRYNSPTTSGITLTIDRYNTAPVTIRLESSP